MSKSHYEQRGDARTKTPERHQVEMQFLSLDQWLDKGHRVRTVWQYVESLDLSEIYDAIKARSGTVGRDAIEPRILFALWLFATLEGITSARRIGELTTRDIPYMWICGHVGVNYHRLADFRTEHGELLERCLTNSIAVLLHQGLVTLETVGQDGMRVRAAAGSGSFRRAPSLQEALRQAEEHMHKVRQQAAEETDGGNARRRAAQERAAREQKQRIEAAIEELKDIQNRFDKRTSGTKRSEPRASTTDPESRRMKMGDNGTRPALNVQFASDADAQLIIAVDVTSQGSDAGLLRPMYDAVQRQYGVKPHGYLVDGGFGKKEDVTYVEGEGTKVYAPLYAEQKQLDKGEDPYAPRADESPEMSAHRQRMGTPEGKAQYARRGATAEFPNAFCRNTGLYQFRVRGRRKTKAQALWHAFAYNFMRLLNLTCPQRKMNYLEILMIN
jgi:transposase